MYQYQMGHLLPLQRQQRLHEDNVAGYPALGNVHDAGWETASSCFHVPYNISRWSDSAMASTAGRSPAEEQLLPGAVAASPATSVLAQQLVLQLHNERVDLGDLIRLQNERMQSELEEMRERHSQALILAMQQGVLRHLQQKENELESAKRRNAELEEKIRQLATENGMWLSVARNSEAIASSLRAGLERILSQNVNPVGAVTPLDLEEGCGDSDSVTPATLGVVEEAQPCFYHAGPVAAAGEGGGKQGKCRMCSEGEVSVLVLPCRHVCLCEQCEPRFAACPVCQAAINATLHVLFG